MNFCKRSYQPILRYLYTKVKKRRGEISLHKHFKLLERRERFSKSSEVLSAEGLLLNLSRCL